ERARLRRDLVLKIMADQGIVTAREASAAAHEALGVARRPAGAYYPAYLDFVRRTLRRDYHDQDLTEAGLRIYTSLEPRAQEQAEQALEHELTRLDRQRRHAQEPLEGAVVVTSPQSGDVIAIVGGRNVGYDGFDRALDAHRSMGSLVKPFIYLTALESGHYNAATVVQDAPIDVALAKDKHWRPENFTHQTYGPVPVVRALAEFATVSIDTYKAEVAAAALQAGAEIVNDISGGTLDPVPPARCCPQTWWWPESPARHRSSATAGSPDSPAVTWRWCGWGTTTMSRRGSPAPPERCRCGRASWRDWARTPGTRRCRTTSWKCTSSIPPDCGWCRVVRRTSWRSPCRRTPHCLPSPAAASPTARILSRPYWTAPSGGCAASGTDARRYEGGRGARGARLEALS
ncbi:MAG: hypothetical protein E6K44_13070, partial [Gammaproteobacteria bacterium]